MSLYRSRVVMVGSDKDMNRLCRVMLENSGWLDEPQDSPPLRREALLEQIAKHARQEAGTSAQFLYSMIAPSPYGDAVSERCLFAIRQLSCGLWTACFTFDSFHPFQSEDWLELHLRCNRAPLYAIYASEEFGLSKGGLAFIGGNTREDWSMMAESYLWLWTQYEAGISPEEIVVRLKALEKAMARELWDQSVTELLQSCRAHLTALEAAESVTADMLREAEAQRDFETLEALQAEQAAYILWDADRAAKWAACIDASLDAWQMA